MIKCNITFDYFANDPKSQVIEVFPDVHGDTRGSFAEVLKSDVYDHDNWISDLSWIKQVNRSKSSSMTLRGCHAQKAPYCQGKLVQAVTERIFDVITDARPDSQTFGVTQAFILDSTIQNMLWVPRGFLHAFVVPKDVEHATFEYFCDNIYDKASEIGIAPTSFLKRSFESVDKEKIPTEFKTLVEMLNDEEHLNLSQKDRDALDYSKQMNTWMSEFIKNSTVWYR